MFAPCQIIFEQGYGNIEDTNTCVGFRSKCVVAGQQRMHVSVTEESLVYEGRIPGVWSKGSLVEGSSMCGGRIPNVRRKDPGVRRKDPRCTEEGSPVYGGRIPGVRRKDPRCTEEGYPVYGGRIPGVRRKDPWCTDEGSLVYGGRIPGV